MRLRKNLNEPAFSYRHLYYFWVVGQEGGIARAAGRLNVAVQTVSAQVRELERTLGCQLLKAQGRGVAVTEAGAAALRHAEQIFSLGDQLASAVRTAGRAPSIRLAVGVSDGMPKLVVRRLLHPIIRQDGLRLRCEEGSYEHLLGELALHHLDLVLADRSPPVNRNLRVYSHPVGSSAFSWYAAASLAARAAKDFPASLSTAPVLLPTSHSIVRAQVDRWFERHSIAPRIAGEFQDSALLKTFGAAGMGVFPAADWTHKELTERYRVRRIASCENVIETFFAIGTERKIQHPLIQRLIPR